MKQGCEICAGDLTTADLATFWQQARQRGFEAHDSERLGSTLFPQAVDVVGSSAAGMTAECLWQPTWPYIDSITGKTAAGACPRLRSQDRRAVDHRRRAVLEVRVGGRRLQASHRHHRQRGHARPGAHDEAGDLPWPHRLHGPGDLVQSTQEQTARGERLQGPGRRLPVATRQDLSVRAHPRGHRPEFGDSPRRVTRPMAYEVAVYRARRLPYSPAE